VIAAIMGTGSSTEESTCPPAVRSCTVKPAIMATIPASSIETINSARPAASPHHARGDRVGGSWMTTSSVRAGTGVPGPVPRPAAMPR
jgi:hypothetical protein